MSSNTERVGIYSGIQRRRRYSVDEKLRILQEAVLLGDLEELRMKAVLTGAIRISLDDDGCRVIEQQVLRYPAEVLERRLTSPRYFVAIYNWSKVLPGSLQGKERKR
jgi:hypothetical protein